MSIPEKIIKEIDMLSEQERQKVLDKKRKIYGSRRNFVGGKLLLVRKRGERHIQCSIK